MTSKIKELDGDNFNAFVKSSDKAVVDFWAEWCGPCIMMAPIFEEASSEMKDKAKFGKVNVDDNSELAQRFQVMSIPTTIIFRDGQQIDRFVGVVSKEELIERIKKAK